MTTGTKFDARFEDTIDVLERKLASATSEYDRIVDRQHKLRESIKACLRRVGVVRAQSLDRGEAVGDDRALVLAQSSLRARTERLLAIDESLPDLEKTAEARVAERTAAREAHDACAADLAQFYAECDGGLAETAAHRDLLADAKAKSEQLREAEARVAAAEQEHAQKAAAYTGDPIFSYLYAAGYDTDRYASNRLVKLVDGWLARLCDFSRASIDYRALTELPGYLAGIARTLKESADLAAQRVSDSVLAARRLAGAEAREQRLEQLLQQRQTADNAAAAARGRVRDAKRERDQIMLWEDPISRKIVGDLENAYAHLEQGLLGDLVLATPSPEDDEAMAAIATHRRELQGLDGTKQQAREEVESIKGRVASIRTVRARFRAQNYDSGNYTVGSGSSDILTALAAGSMSHDAAWSRLQSQTRYDPPSSPSSSSSDSGGFGGSSSFDSGGSFGGGSSDSFDTGGGF